MALDLKKVDTRLLIFFAISAVSIGLLVLILFTLQREYDVKKNPFSQVTNRQFSLFQGQFPEYATDDGNKFPDPDSADAYIRASSEQLFMYHTWDRLLGNVLIRRPIPYSEFQEFLDHDKQWQPKNWKEAPHGYVSFIKSLAGQQQPLLLFDDMQNLAEENLPLIVRRAFLGWKNRVYEKDAIRDFQPSYGLVQQFLANYPIYARNYWQNIVKDNYPHYLEKPTPANADLHAQIPQEQLAPFLRVALYNYQQSKQRS